MWFQDLFDREIGQLRLVDLLFREENFLQQFLTKVVPQSRGSYKH